MTEKLKIPYPIVVEGKYDKIKVGSVAEADIFITSGFGIFRNDELSALFRKLSESTPIIILTDSDGAGALIRKRFSSMIPTDRLINLYVPEIKGKEKRKAHPSKAGNLGVEGIDSEIIREVLSPFATGKPACHGGITKSDLYFLGLCGYENSAKLRSGFAQHLGFPASITSTALLSAVNIIYTREKFMNEAEKFLAASADSR